MGEKSNAYTILMGKSEPLKIQSLYVSMILKRISNSQDGKVWTKYVAEDRKK
jgi:hypothetical protein